jgi:hypothetical protein
VASAAGRDSKQGVCVTGDATAGGMSENVANMASFAICSS